MLLQYWAIVNPVLYILLESFLEKSCVITNMPVLWFSNELIFLQRDALNCLKTDKLKHMQKYVFKYLQTDVQIVTRNMYSMSLGGCAEMYADWCNWCIQMLTDRKYSSVCRQMYSNVCRSMNFGHLRSHNWLRCLQTDVLKYLQTEVLEYMKRDILRCLQAFAFKCLMKVYTNVGRNIFVKVYRQP